MASAHTELDYEKIILNPPDMDKRTRAKLFSVLRDLGVHFEYEQY